MSPADKLFLDAETLLRDSFELALRVFESGFAPTFILGVWRGGTPVGIAVQEVLETLRCPTEHFAIRTSSYGGGTEGGPVEVYGLQQVVDLINAEDRLLIVDDIFDSGRSVAAIIEQLSTRARANCPSALKGGGIRVATLYYKPARNTTDRVPDYYVHETDRWTVFPHELRGCTVEELRRTKRLPERYFGMDPEI